MQKIKSALNYFSKAELMLWGLSAAVIIISFAAFRMENRLNLYASLIGVTSLIFNAKGNPAGQALTIVFSALYGIISYSFAYYGEMITYLGMTAPMAAAAMISWLRNPFNGRRSQVTVNTLNRRDIVLMIALTAAVTAIFYFILRALNTTNLALSTVSVATSFAAVYLTFRRSAYYALAYAANDIVLIALWILASFEDRAYIAVVICFIAFLANDIYGFINWKWMHAAQRSAA